MTGQERTDGTRRKGERKRGDGTGENRRDGWRMEKEREETGRERVGGTKGMVGDESGREESYLFGGNRCSGKKDYLFGENFGARLRRDADGPDPKKNNNSVSLCS